ncbi:adenylate/guanylate cyclase domain-containing protein, partial [Undibacterium sp.]|uniref:CHASE2 domain-containing protein n=1 Tax=Undibacterium sp. TaxID=1914977 RepID=UPI002BC9E66C
PSETYPGDEWLRDRFINMRANETPETRVALVDIDETSLAALGPWPWPRTRIVELIERLLADYRVRGVALDIFFAEPGDTDGDIRLSLLAKHGPVVFAQAFDYDALRDPPLRRGVLGGGQLQAALLPAAIERTHSTIPNPAAGYGFVGNYADLADARHVGNIGFLPDADGTLRHLPPYTLFEGRYYPTLSKALFDCCAPKNKADSAAWDYYSRGVNREGFVRVPYSKALSAYQVIPASAILQQSISPDLLRGKLVVIGSSSLSLSDRVATPLSSSANGFLVHAEALTSLLDAQEGHAPMAWPGKWIAILFSALVAGIAVYTFPRLSALSNIGVLAGASGLWLLLAYQISLHDDFFSPSGPLLAHFFLLAVAVPFGWQTSQGKSRRLLGTLQQYVAKAVVTELLRSDLKDPLAPRKLHVTTLIADMEGYTNQVENLTIEEAAHLTRDFLECLTEPVLEHMGTLDKYTGDGLVAFWGAPLPIENHADLALDAAIKIIRNVRQLSMKKQLSGHKPLRVRIGIESGIAMAGDFGTSSRSIYTAVGDSVNVASRLEDAARDLPHDVIIGQGTVDNATRHGFKFLGQRMLRGKEKPTTIFTLEIPG